MYLLGTCQPPGSRVAALAILVALDTKFFWLNCWTIMILVLEGGPVTMHHLKAGRRRIPFFLSP